MIKYPNRSYLRWGGGILAYNSVRAMVCYAREGTATKAGSREQEVGLDYKAP